MLKKKATDEKKSAGPAGQETERCNWTDADESHLIEYITTHQAKGGDGLNFDKTFWAQATIDVAHTTSGGVVKSPVACHQKWKRMCTTFHVVDQIANFSGISWNNKCGANITPESESVWADLTKEVPLAKPFKKKGWLLYEKMSNIMPSKAGSSNTYYTLLQSNPPTCCNLPLTHK
ncbi:hypothetical protein EDB19DRAFT_1917222 [Suillus lakei]|nr:hypothetical protein EDB19DRAFT_1917222 [Suillus lakei]